ncbi:MAG: BCCT family transporter [Nitrospirae bacterium]|nr:MAG: BCCT family transporter [Nitrospirota bacterium]
MKHACNPRVRGTIHPVVFWGTAACAIGFVILCLLNLSRMSQVFATIQAIIAHRAGWVYILAVNIFLLSCLVLLIGRYGAIRLGGPTAQPEFTYRGWFAMLFSAGMGIGLVFYSVAEPILHYVTPPYGEGRTAQSAQLAMNLTFLHWGIHCWAVYGLVGLALAFFSFNRKLPLTMRSVLYPLLGEKIYGMAGNLVDILAAVATLFGLATSLGLGVQQINAGLAHLFSLPQNVTVQIGLIVVITACATTSVVLGLDRGIRRLSVLNMVLATLLLGFVLFAGPTVFVFNAMLQNVGQYVQHLPELGTWAEAYTQTNWQDQWTLFFWGWWIAWSPFVGMFIARISRGRTIREFLLGVILVPTVMTIVWVGVFGNTALFVEVFGQGTLAQAVSDNLAVALFVLLEQFPLAALSCLLGIAVVVIFFVSSSDSASLVVDIVTAGGHPDPPVKQRIFWASMEGVIAAVLLLGGGLQALQAASLTSGLPFAGILLVMTLSLFLGLREEARTTRVSPRTEHSGWSR